MHHTCPQCEAVVADTQPFCGHCRAPQIRMGGSSEADASAPTAQNAPLTPLAEEARKNFAQSEPAVPLQQLDRPPTAIPRAPIQWAYSLPRLGMIGLATMLSMTVVPIPIVNLLFVPLGCAVAVWFYARKTTPILPTTGQGAVLGFITSFFAFIFTSIMIGAVYTYQKNEFQKAIKDAIDKSVADNPDPQVRQAMQQFLTPEGMVFVLAIGVVLVMLVFLALGSSGGAAAAAFLRRKNNGNGSRGTGNP